jgi:hypothetical protein
VEDDAESQASRAAAVLHALADVEVMDRGDGVMRVGDHAPDEARSGGAFLALAGCNEGHVARRQGDELGVEEVRADRLGDGQLVPHYGDADEGSVHGAVDPVDDRLRVDERILVVEEHASVADGDDVVMEHAGVDGVGGLLGEDATLR